MVATDPCETKTSQETKSLPKFFETEAGPKAIHSDNPMEFGKENSIGIIVRQSMNASSRKRYAGSPETHKCAAAAGSFCFVTTENGEQQDVCNWITMPCVQR